MNRTEADGTNVSDADLLQRVQRGDVDAFALLVRRHLPAVRAFVALRLPVPHVADEIAHEAFVFAFRHVREFDAQRPFRPWLRAIAWNLVRAELQRQLLTAHHRMQEALRTTVDAAQFERLRRRLEQVSAPGLPSPDHSIARPGVAPSRQP